MRPQKSVYMTCMLEDFGVVALIIPARSSSSALGLTMAQHTIVNKLCPYRTRLHQRCRVVVNFDHHGRGVRRCKRMTLISWP